MIGLLVTLGHGLGLGIKVVAGQPDHLVLVHPNLTGLADVDLGPATRARIDQIQNSFERLVIHCVQ